MDKTILVLILLVSSKWNCCGQKRSSNLDIKGIVVESLFPNYKLDTVKNEWKLEKYDSIYTKIYYYKDKVLIQRSYQRADSIRQIQGKSTQELVYHRSYSTFIFSESFDKAIAFDSVSFRKSKLINKDSMLKSEWAFAIDMGKNLQQNKHALLSSKRNGDGDLEELYSLSDKNDTTVTGTLLLVFSKNKFPDFNYSLARELEKDRKLKLIKTISVLNPRYDEVSKSHMQGFEIPHEIKEIKINNAKELLQMFQYAEQALKK